MPSRVNKLVKNAVCYFTGNFSQLRGETHKVYPNVCICMLTGCEYPNWMRELNIILWIVLRGQLIEMCEAILTFPVLASHNRTLLLQRSRVELVSPEPGVSKPEVIEFCDSCSHYSIIFALIWFIPSGNYIHLFFLYYKTWSLRSKKNKLQIFKNRVLRKISVGKLGYCITR
jgi:hypothetical protein